MAPVTAGVHHVGLSVSDISKTASFFQALGFNKIGGVDSYPSIFLSDGSVMITVWQTKTNSPASFDRQRNVGLHHLAIKVPSMDALNQAFDIVSNYDGAKVEFGPKPIPGTPITQFMCYEPCGVRVEFDYQA